MTKIAFADALGSLAGGLINSWVLSRWKVLVKGKYFALRSLGSSIIGQIVFILIALSIIFVGQEPLSQVIEIMIASLLTKSVMAMACVYPVSLAALLIKSIEGYDYHDHFTPRIRQIDYLNRGG
jgi:uncharacterized PurR-regulated membrane protein YhhQ (DUF165 family)